MTEISVVIPVGPYPSHKRWLAECLASVAAQVHAPTEVILVDDMAELNPDIWKAGDVPVRIWRSPWRLGQNHAFNIGVALAKTNLALMLGSDDYLHPECLYHIAKTFEAHPTEAGYYYLTVEYLDAREYPLQDLPCAAAAVTKGLWHNTGGFPLECASGASDAALVSILLTHPKAGELIAVRKGHPLYYYRAHDASDTASRGPWQGVIIATRDIVTATWQEPEWWGRYE